jgi:hypothetical protein
MKDVKDLHSKISELSRESKEPNKRSMYLFHGSNDSALPKISILSKLTYRFNITNSNPSKPFCINWQVDSKIYMEMQMT